MELHQLVHTLSYGDAISSEALALRRVFQSEGHESEIYALHSHPEYKKFVRDYRDFPSTFNGQVVLHYSIGSPLNDLYRKLTSARRSLVYHNITPAKWFEDVNPQVAQAIGRGLQELPALCKESDAILADSPFNAMELKEIGFDAKVLELPVDPARWGVERNEGIYQILKREDAVHVLHVGRLAPNKRIEDIIKAFYFLHYHVSRKSRLWLVGIDIDTELYSFALKRIVNELHLRDAVNFVGRLSDSEVRALYEASSVYICMSEHEGFCLPVVEAMHFGLPVIAYSSSAIPATVGDAAVLVSEKRHPELGELMYEVASNSALRQKLISAGHERVSLLSYDRFEAAAREMFL